MSVLLDGLMANNKERCASCAQYGRDVQPLPPPILAALSPFMPKESAIASARAHYIAALHNLDPQGDFIEDGRRHQQWRESLQICRELQREVDPTGEIWLSILTPGHGVPSPVVVA
jgi:hypothetical protein